MALAATTARSTVCFRARFIDIKRSPAEFLSIQAGDSAVRIGIRIHLDKSKTLRPAGITVGDDVDAIDGSVRREQGSNRILGRSKVKVSHKNILHCFSF